MREPPRKTDAPLANALAFGVHIFTASGAALALFALLAAIEHKWGLMFLLLGVALFVDGVDGMFARRLDVAERLPRWSGDVLDLVVDFLTYVFIPAFVVVASGLLPAWLAIPCAIAIIISGALYFADTEMKTKDNYFLRLPGGMERAGVLSVAAQARSVGRGRRDRVARRCDVPAGSVRASVPRGAVARAHRGPARRLVGAGVDCAVARHDARAMDHRLDCAPSRSTSSGPDCCRWPKPE